jgi:hypothetical protein
MVIRPFWIQEGAKELDEHDLAQAELTRATVTVWPGRAGGIRWDMACRARGRILEADAVEGDAMPYREKSQSLDIDLLEYAIVGSMTFFGVLHKMS